MTLGQTSVDLIIMHVLLCYKVLDLHGILTHHWIG